MLEADGVHDALATPLPSVTDSVGVYPVRTTEGTPLLGEPT